MDQSLTDGRLSRLASQPGRGRQATSPLQMPTQGWKDILWRVYHEINDDRVMLVAAGVTYYLILALVPAMSAFVSIYGLFNDPSTVASQIEMLQGIVPGGGLEILNEQLSRLVEQGNASLGLTLLFSVAIALWSANAGAKALFQAMNVAYEESEKRSFLHVTLVSFAFTVAALFAGVLLIGIAVLLPLLLNIVGLGETASVIIRIASYVAILFLASFGVASLYRWGPSRKSAQWQWITPGTVLTVLVVVMASVLFSWYVTNFGSYNATYGSLGALIGFMTWIWIMVTILIVGGELNSEIEHQTSRDSTVGPENPIGRRGAVMADTIGLATGSDDRQARSVRTERDPSSRQSTSRRPLGAGAFALALAAGMFLQWKGRQRGQ